MLVFVKLPVRWRKCLCAKKITEYFLQKMKREHKVMVIIDRKSVEDYSRNCINTVVEDFTAHGAVTSCNLTTS